MNFIHYVDWRNTRVDRERLVEHHLSLEASCNNDEQAAKISALAEIVQAMLLRMPTDDLVAVAKEIGFRAAEEKE